MIHNLDRYKTIRGGDRRLNVNRRRVAYRIVRDPGLRYFSVGIRCIRRVK